MSDFLYLLTPKRATARFLSTTRVTGTYTNQKVDALVFAILRAYAPNIPIELHNPASWPNPTVSVTFPSVPLDAALRDLTSVANVTIDINDKGAIVFRSLTIDEQLKRAHFQSEQLHRMKQ